MGRYMRKNKVAMEVSQSLGVRTRARTLAMARQQAKKLEQQQQQVNVLNFCYLELRSRKLEKLFELSSSSKRSKHSSKPPKTTQSRVRTSDAIGLVSVGAAPLSRSNSFTSSKQQQQQQQQQQSPVGSMRNEEIGEALHCADSRTSGQVETMCGDNAFDHDGHSSRDSFGPEHHRRLRESTPVCTDQEHQQRIADAPGSSSKVRLTSRAPASTHPEDSFDVPTPEDIESFFAANEQEPDDEKRRLSDRYNYDFANDCPLPGRFEWTSTRSS